MFQRGALFLALALAALPAAATQVFTGSSPSGARWRIEAPDGWKAGDGLVLFQRGFSFDYGQDAQPDLGPLRELQLSEGYAVAASTFSQRGWAVFTAMDDNRDVLNAVRQHLGEPGEVIPFGGSLGGLLALKLAESPAFAGKVKEVFSLCPAAAGSRLWDEALDIRLGYDVICAGAGSLPHGAQPYPWAYDLDDIPSGISDFTDELQLLPTLVPLNQCTGVNLNDSLRNGAMKRRLAELKAFSGIQDDDFIATNFAYATLALSDLVRQPDKLGNLAGNGNLGVDYGDAATNAAIARVTPDAMAQLRLKWLSDFRGDVGAAKVLSLHTSRDELVVPANQSVLRARLPADQRVSALVDEDSPSHCGFKTAEGIAGWEALRAWSAGGAQPDAAELQGRCMDAVAQGADGPCRFDPVGAVPDLDSQIRPRPAQIAAPAIDARYSGNWADPQRDGEGIALEILDDQRAVVYFFTYPPRALLNGAPAPDKRDQAWMVAAGTITPEGIAFDDVNYYPTVGAPPNVPNTYWGKLWLTFQDCTHGRLRWDGPPGWGSLDVPIERLTSLKDLGCVYDRDVAHVQTSGSWYDPAHSGSGLHIEQLDATHTLAMYYVAPNGSSPLTVGWYIGVADGAPDATGATPAFDLVRSYGAAFGPDYDPADVHHDASTASLQLKLGCSSGSASLHVAGANGGSTYALALQRLTTPAGVTPCP